MAAAENFQRTSEHIRDTQVRFLDLSFRRQALHAAGGDPDATEIAPGWVQYSALADPDFTGRELSEPERQDLLNNHGRLNTSSLPKPQGEVRSEPVIEKKTRLIPLLGKAIASFVNDFGKEDLDRVSGRIS